MNTTIKAISTSVTVRVSRADDGPLIHDLFLASRKWDISCVDWSQDVGPYWLIAEIKGIPWGCIMVRPGRPLGSLEFLCVPAALPHKTKAKLVRTLCYAGLASLKRAGAQVCSFVLHPGQEGWERVLSRRRGVKWFTGNVYLMEL